MAKDATPAAALTAHERQVADALMMLDFAFNSGTKATDGSAITQSW
jgi:hypothetical protein